VRAIHYPLSFKREHLHEFSRDENIPDDLRQCYHFTTPGPRMPSRHMGLRTVRYRSVDLTEPTSTSTSQKFSNLIPSHFISYHLITHLLRIRAQWLARLLLPAYRRAYVPKQSRERDGLIYNDAVFKLQALRQYRD
jgi:hypothetical protein